MPVSLTAQQRRFAKEHDARPGHPLASLRGAAFMYRDHGAVCIRWLVDPQGRVLDTARLPCDGDRKVS